jgi:hypothetical protein
MNMVLGDAEEYRRIKSKKGQGLVEDREEKRSLGLIILRGDSIVSMVILFLFLFYFILFYFPIGLIILRNTVYAYVCGRL